MNSASSSSSSSDGNVSVSLEDIRRNGGDRGNWGAPASPRGSNYSEDVSPPRPNSRGFFNTVVNNRFTQGVAQFVGGGSVMTASVPFILDDTLCNLGPFAYMEGALFKSAVALGALSALTLGFGFYYYYSERNHTESNDETRSLKGGVIGRGVNESSDELRRLREENITLCNVIGAAVDAGRITYDNGMKNQIFGHYLPATVVKKIEDCKPVDGVVYIGDSEDYELRFEARDSDGNWLPKTLQQDHSFNKKHNSFSDTMNTSSDGIIEISITGTTATGISSVKLETDSSSSSSSS